MFDQSIIKSCTVNTRREVLGKFVQYHCSHKFLDMLEMGIDQIMNRTDKSLQPVASVPMYFGSMGWCSTVSFYANECDVPSLYEVTK